MTRNSPMRRALLPKLFVTHKIQVSTCRGPDALAGTGNGVPVRTIVSGVDELRRHRKRAARRLDDPGNLNQEALASLEKLQAVGCHHICKQLELDGLCAKR